MLTNVAVMAVKPKSGIRYGTCSLLLAKTSILHVLSCQVLELTTGQIQESDWSGALVTGNL